GRLFDVRGVGMREVAVDARRLTAEAAIAKRKLRRVIDATMQPPLSTTARQEVDAYGRPIRKK
ncbi:MAG: hypothetical protein HON53_01150, partial [Planctomycetaceae bacterium]|nr:hypothetical protein [Planctomycetaceae bacterium]